MPELLTRTAFEPHCDTTFHVRYEEGDPLALELIEVTDKTPEGFPGEQFSLIFRGPLEAYLSQRTYALEHPGMGHIDLFLVPVDERKDGYRYEAYFNHAAVDDA